MSWSFGETQALARKAAFGAGKSWGAAEETGWAVRWLAERGLFGPEALATYLVEGAAGCPIDAGISFCDNGLLEVPCEFGDLRAPLLFVPFASRLVGAGASLELAVGAVEIQVSSDAIAVRGTPPSRGSLRAARWSGAMEAPSLCQRVEAISPDALAVLERFAARTYAPATDASREAGAGAGLQDND